MKRAIAASVVVWALASSAASASPTSAPSPTAATAALGRLLHQLYGEVDGYWTCPAAARIDERIDCLAEIHRARDWHEVALSARFRNGVLVFTTLAKDAAQTWVRHWSPYSRHFIVRFHEPAPGVASVNSSSSFYDWGWIARGADGLKPGQIRRVGANDSGPVTGFERFDVFSCARQGGLITCRNALGDAMRYRPGG